MNKRTKEIVILVGAVVFVFASYYIIPLFNRDQYRVVSVKSNTESASTTPVAEKEIVPHLETPEAVKAIYMTNCAASTQSFRTSLLKLIDDTEINSIVIDIKDYTGTISFKPEDPALLEYYKASNCPVPDMKEFLKVLHDKNIYIIGRITVFQDPFYTKKYPEVAVKRASDGGVWKDRKGISYIDPSSEQAWAHVISIAREAYGIGFDEINFDYIRFPSDGNMRDIAFPFSKNTPKADAVEKFFKHVHDELDGSGIVTSADLFGMTTTNYDDMNIGQVLEKAMPYFDYIAPMVYPSHYPATFNGWQNPNAHPYELIKYVMEIGARRAQATSSPIHSINSQPIASTTPQKYTKESYSPTKLRPWLQDFSLGKPTYTATEVRDQIRATYDAGLTSWMLWDAANRYTPEALEAQ